MKILIRNSDHVVLFAGDDLALTETEASGNGWRAHFLTTENATLADADVPSPFSGGMYSYDGAWHIADQAAYDAAVEDAATKDRIAARATAKENRDKAVATLKVTTAAGNTFDGDEVSQGRMARAIIALQATGTASINWTLANNTVIEASATELIEALAKSGAAQAAIWVIP